MILTHISLENFKNFGKKEIDFTPGINVLQGPNGSGKTSILEAIEFALYGSVIGRGGLEPLIRFGETSASVSLTFEAEDSAQKRVFTVSRSLSKGETGTSTVKTQLLKDGSEVSSKKVRVDAELIRLIGMNHTSYANAVYLRQGEIRSLLEAGKEREREIDRMIGLGVFEDVWRDLRKTESDLERETSRAKEALVGLRAEVQTLLSVSEELSRRMEEKIRLEDEIQSAEEALAKAGGLTPTDTSTHPGAKPAVQVERDQAAQSEKVRGLEEQLLESERRIESANDRLLEMEAEILRGEKRIESLAEEKKNLQDRLARTDEEAKGLRETLKEISQEVLRLEADLEVQKSLVTSFSRMEATGEPVCPVCGSQLTPEHARNARKSLDGKIRKLQEAIEDRRLDLRRFEQSADAASSRRARIQTQIEEVSKEISEAEAQNTGLGVTKEELEADLAIDLKRKRDLESALQRERATLRELESAPPTKFGLGAGDRLAEAKAKYLADKRLLERLEEEIPRLMERLGEEQMKRKKLEEAEKHHSELSRRLKRVRDLRWAFNNIGPFARKKVLPTVEDRTRELFRKMYSGGFLQDVELSQDYDMIAKSSSGIHLPSRLLSVGERVLAGLALRIALSQISLTFTGTVAEPATGGTPGFLILDEPTEYLDEFNVRTLGTALADLEGMGQIVVVTHDRELVDRMSERSSILLPGPANND